MGDGAQKQGNLEQQIQTLTEKVEQVKSCLETIAKPLDAASAVKEASNAANAAKEAVQKLDRFLKLLKPPIWGLVWLALATVAYVVILLFVIAPKLATQNLNTLSVWHNITLLLFPTVAFAFTVWAIVRICQPE